MGSGHNPLRGALWMSAAVLSFAVMAISVRELLRHMGIPEILAWRTFVTLVIATAVVVRHGTATIRTRRLPLHATRALVHLGGQFCWMYAIAALALATVFAIEFTMPVWTALLAFAFLGERLTPNRIVMLVLGLVGIAIILRPGVGRFHPAALVMLFGALLYAGNMIFTKSLSATDSAVGVAFWMSAVQTPVTLAAAWAKWVMPQAIDAPWIAAIGAGSFAAHYSMTRAMKHADATVVVPIDFSRLPLIAVVGAIFYGEPFDPFVLLGAGVIFSGTYYSLRHELRR